MAGQEPFPHWLAVSMETYDLSRLDVAAALRVYYNVLLDWLNGVSKPADGEIARLAEYFEVPLTRLHAIVNLDEEPEAVAEGYTDL